MKRCIFTVNLSDYDAPELPNADGWDKVIITDSKDDLKGWDKVIRVNPTNNPALESRRYKWLSHIHLPEYELVCYFDGNMLIFNSPPAIPFRIKHFKRDTLRQECDALNAQLHRCTVESVENQYNYYLSQGYDENFPLWLNGFFCREHSEKENQLCEMVWEQLNRFTPRDMIALPYCMWKLGYEPENIEGRSFLDTYLKIGYHKQTAPEIYKG